MVAAGRLFLISKNEEIKDFTKMIVKVVSVIMSAYLSVLEIPMTSVLLQGYLCEEDLDDIYILEDV